MDIRTSTKTQSHQVRSNPGTTNKTEESNSEFQYEDSFMQSHGSSMLFGAALGAMSSVPVIGALPTGGMANETLFKEPEYWDRHSAFRTLSGLGMAASAAANIVGTYQLMTGNAGLGLALLGGAGAVSGTVMALNMDGGSMAADLGLKK